MVVKAPGRDGEPSESLVAVDERVVAHDGCQESPGLEVEALVGVMAEGARARSVGGRVELAEVLDRPDPEVVDKCEEIFGRQVLDGSAAQAVEEVCVPLPTARGQG